MERWKIAVLMLSLSAMATADSVDDFKAARDGKTVEQVRIERLQDSVGDLQEKLKAAISRADTAEASVSLQVIGGQMPKAAIFARKHGVAGLLHGRR